MKDGKIVNRTRNTSYRNTKQLCSFSKLSVTSPTSQLILILQAFHHFTYVTAHSPTLPSLYLHHNSFSNPSVASPTSQIILQPFFRFSYVTGFSLTSPGEPPMPLLQSKYIKWVLLNIIYTQPNQWRILMNIFRYTTSFILHNFAYNCNSCISFIDNFSNLNLLESQLHSTGQKNLLNLKKIL